VEHSEGGSDTARAEELRHSGLLHALLDLGDGGAVEAHPRVGPSWEGFALDAVVTQLGALAEECHSWAAHSGAELELLVVRGKVRLRFEFKRTTAPATTRSMHVALEGLRLSRIDVVHAGSRSFPNFPKHQTIRAIALSRLMEDLKPLK
jgi:hypothetical protein